MSDWPERKRAELTAKLASVDAELTFWSGQAQLNGRLEKHHTQVERLRADLSPVGTQLRADIAAANVATDWTRLERSVLDLHRVWDFFREKLALRFVPLFEDYLLAADEVAWSCYRVAQEAATAVDSSSVREPPLVCFVPLTTPFSMPRGTSYAADVGGAPLASPLARRLVERLPVPVVGVPWYQLSHLPDMLILAHEVGHHVENDCALAPTVARLVREALPAAEHLELDCGHVPQLERPQQVNRAILDHLGAA